VIFFQSTPSPLMEWQQCSLVTSAVQRNLPPPPPPPPLALVFVNKWSLGTIRVGLVRRVHKILLKSSRAADPYPSGSLPVRVLVCLDPYPSESLPVRVLVRPDPYPSGSLSNIHPDPYPSRSLSVWILTCPDPHPSGS
jgi:hypothetical protein